MRISKRRKLRPALAFVLVVVLAALVVYPFIHHVLHPTRYIKSPEYILKVSRPSLQEGEVVEEQLTLTRGTKVTLEERGDITSKVSWNGEILSVPNENLADSINDVVDIEYIYPRKLVSLRESKGGKLVDEVVKKGEALQVVHVDPKDLNTETGEIAWYQVVKDGESYFVAGTNMETTPENAMKTYAENLQVSTLYDSVFGDGYARNAYVEQPDFRGSVQPDFEDNPRREDIQAIHINLDTLISQKDYLIDLKNQTGLNALVVALKGPDGKLRYDSDVPANYFNDTTNVLSQTYISKADLKELFQELKDAGFYIVGRMETFADAALAWDHPEWAVTGADGLPYMMSEDYWISAYSRDGWMYNGDLAKEFAELGCNEVQFDFVRFADAGAQAEADGTTNYKNKYDESKVAAVQGFLYYIREELEPLHVYTAADMYAGPVVENNDYDIGHYYPAIAAAANVVEPMVYLDTFNIPLVDKEESTQWERDTIAAFVQLAKRSVSTLENPGLLRLYLQGYNDTSAERVADEIHGIMDAGSSGYVLWTDRGLKENLEVLKDGLIDSAPETEDPSSSSAESSDSEQKKTQKRSNLAPETETDEDTGENSSGESASKNIKDLQPASDADASADAVSDESAAGNTEAEEIGYEVDSDFQ